MCRINFWRKRERKKKKNNKNKNNNNKPSKHNISPKLRLGDIIMLYDHNTHFFCRHLYVNHAELIQPNPDKTFSPEFFDDSVGRLDYICTELNLNQFYP